MKPRMLSVLLVVGTVLVLVLPRPQPTTHDLARSASVLAAPMSRPLSDPPWGSNVMVSDEPGTLPEGYPSQGHPSVAVDPQGNAYAVWDDYRNLNSDIYFSYRRAGGSWVTNEKVNDDAGSAGQYLPSVAVDLQGNAYAVWHDRRNGGYDIYFSYRPAGGSWVTNEKVNDESGVASYFPPSVAVDLQGNAYAVWIEERDGVHAIYFSYRPAAGSWGTNEKVNDVPWDGGYSYPSIAVDLSGNAYAVWGDNRNNVNAIYFSYRPAGGSWVTNEKVSDELGTLHKGCPSVAVDLQGNAYAVWEDNRNEGGYWWDIYFSYRPAGGSWVTNEKVNDDTTNADQNSPSIAVDSSGNAYAVWEDMPAGLDWDIYFSYRPAGGSWATNEKVNDDTANADQNSPSIAVDPSGNAYALWEDSRMDVNGDIYFSYRTAGGLTPRDIGFRPDPDGYDFDNYGGLNPADYTTDDMRRMFGNDAVCWMVGSVCFVKPQAALWHRLAHVWLSLGHCDGMASTSLRFFKDLDNPADLQPAANTTHDLQLGNARRHIAYYFLKQLTDPVKSYKEQVRQNAPSAILHQLHSAMSSGAPDPTTLFVRQAGQGGHAITPYAIEDQGNGVYRVRVYDNNHSNDGNKYVVINTTNNTWSYDLGWATWNGDTSTDSLGIVPISKYAEQSVCPWCAGAGAGALSTSPSGEVSLTGEGHLLITDGQGRRIGYVGDQLVNEVPGAYGSVFDAGLGIEMEPVYTIPLTETYTILVSGQTLTQTETVGVAQFGPGYAVSVSDLALNPTSADELVVAPDGTQFAYQSNDDKEPTLTLAVDGIGESSKLQLSGADIAAGQPVTVTADVNIGRFAFDNSEAGGGTYDLEVTLISGAGARWFVHSGVVIATTDTHYADYGTWDGYGSMTLYVDQGSDGNIDQTVILHNQAPRTYLPLVLRNH